ncbi:hypothetical protein GN244_ATG02419 [Phytophthora infestans]|uniref:Uncharacterized protein n=1 Tax=Phytophthora infestans TaxID=4787 RepID=A0A833WLW1_PHYIN|nr:hypothetical protein GN244_ATG02419 [Phytophthora infestans]
MPTCTTAKRVRAKKRMEELERELASMEKQHESGAGEMTRLLVFFREEAGLRAAADAKRRREEREERELADKREREQRDRDRRAGTALVEQRLQQQRL